MGRTVGPFLENTVFHTGKNPLSDDVWNGEFSQTLVTISALDSKGFSFRTWNYCRLEGYMRKHIRQRWAGLSGGQTR